MTSFGTAGALVARHGGLPAPRPPCDDRWTTPSSPSRCRDRRHRCPAAVSTSSSIRQRSGQRSVNGITFQVLRQRRHIADNPRLTGRPGQAVRDHPGGSRRPPRPTHGQPLQRGRGLPGRAGAVNPRGEYNENLIVHSPGAAAGRRPRRLRRGRHLRARLDHRRLGLQPGQRQGAAWITLLSGLTYSGEPACRRRGGHSSTTPNGSSRRPLVRRINGFTITGGGERAGLRANVNVTGGSNTPYGAAGALVDPGRRHLRPRQRPQPAGHRQRDRGNGGSYGGGIRIGTPYVGNNRNYDACDRPQPDPRQRRHQPGRRHRDLRRQRRLPGRRQRHLRQLLRRSTAAVSPPSATWARTSGGTISRNRIWFNGSYDEGGGIMVGGELPADPTALSEGSGPVTIEHNMIQANLANDDGGGIRPPRWLAHQPAINDRQQHHREQRLGPRGRRHRARRRGLRGHRQQHGHEEHHHGHRGDQQRPAGAGRAVDRGEQRPAAGAHARRRSRARGHAPATHFSKPMLFNDVFWDNRAGSWDRRLRVTASAPLPDGYDGGQQLGHGRRRRPDRRCVHWRRRNSVHPDDAGVPRRRHRPP